VHVELRADKAYYICFHELGLFSAFNVNVDMGAALLRIHAQSSDGAQHADRASKLPCGLVRPELVTAVKRDGCVVVTIPFAAQGRMGVTMQHTLMSPEEEPTELVVHVTSAPVSRLETKDEAGVLHITVSGLLAGSGAVALDGEVLKITGKAMPGASPIVRHYKLKRRVQDASLIKATVVPDGTIHITCPDGALEAEHQWVKAPIPVKTMPT
jgi:hypothetical protein